MKYMKNLKLHELVIVSVICILLCIEFSIIGKIVLGIEADFLSGGATLFAAFIAYIIFNDWREQYRIELIKEIRDKLHLLFTEAENKTDKFYIEVKKAEKGTPFEIKYIAELAKEMQNTFEHLLPEIDFLRKLIRKFEYKITNSKANLDEIEDKILLLIANLTKETNIEDQRKTVISYSRILSELDICDFIKEKKIFLNEELQIMIIKFYDIK